MTRTRSTRLFDDDVNVRLDYMFTKTRKLMATILLDPSKVDLIPDEDVYIWKRLHRWHTMTHDEAMDMVEADYQLFYSWL